MVFIFSGIYFWWYLFLVVFILVVFIFGGIYFGRIYFGGIYFWCYLFWWYLILWYLIMGPIFFLSIGLVICCWWPLTILLSGSLLPCSYRCEFVSSWAHQSENIQTSPRSPTSWMSHFLLSTRRNACSTSAPLRGSGIGAWFRAWLGRVLALWRVSSSHEEVDQQRSEWVACGDVICM